MKNSRPNEGVICEAMHENKLPECLKTVGITCFFEKFCKNTRTKKGHPKGCPFDFDCSRDGKGRIYFSLLKNTVYLEPVGKAEM